MYKIEYTALNYYTSPISSECMCLGVLTYNKSTGDRDFTYITHFRRLSVFDDEVDIEFVKAYLKGIKEEVSNSILNYGKEFSMEKYIYNFANEFRFSKIKFLDVKENENYTDDLVKLYLKYDVQKSSRLDSEAERKLIRRILKDNKMAYSTDKAVGEYKDEISFDYKLNDMYIKHFSFSGDLKRSISSARQWSFAAGEVSSEKTVLFIYDTDHNDQDNLSIILKILSKHAKTVTFDDGIDYILQHNTI